MKAQTVITITSKKLDKKSEKVIDELLKSPALLESTKDILGETIGELFESEKREETIEIDFRKVD